ncbi:PII-interacting protein PipX family protein, partial [Synechocystis salina]
MDDNQEIFTTLYAQRLFFLVKTTPNNTQFEPITRADLLIETS